MVYFYLIYIYTSLFWWNYIHALFFFWYILLLIPACLELIFFKQSLLYRFFLFVLSVNRQILEQVEKVMLWKNNIIGWILLQFPVLSEIDGNSHAFPMW